VVGWLTAAKAALQTVEGAVKRYGSWIPAYAAGAGWLQPRERAKLPHPAMFLDQKDR